MTATNKTTKSSSWDGSIGRSFSGSVFASTVIKTLTSSTSPLFNNRQSSASGIPCGPDQVELDDNALEKDEIQWDECGPKAGNDDEEHVATYNAFCHAIR